MHAMVVVYVASIKCLHFSVFVISQLIVEVHGEEITCTADCFYRLGYSSNTSGGVRSVLSAWMLSLNLFSPTPALCCN